MVKKQSEILINKYDNAGYITELIEKYKTGKLTEKEKIELIEFGKKIERIREEKRGSKASKEADMPKSKEKAKSKGITEITIAVETKPMTKKINNADNKESVTNFVSKNYGSKNGNENYGIRKALYYRIFGTKGGKYTGTEEQNIALLNELKKIEKNNAGLKIKEKSL